MMSVYDLIYDSLIEIDDDYLPQPGIAESWDMTSNGRDWTFHLRNNVYFSNGVQLTANDVVATAQAILDLANTEGGDQGYYVNLKYFVDRISAEDDLTVKVRAKSGRAYYGLLYAMTFPVLPAASVNADNPLGSGPYYVDTFDPMNTLTLKPNPYWQQGNPQVKDIMFHMSDAQRAVMEDYELARVDAVFTRAIAAAQYKSGTTSLALDYRTNQLETLLMNRSYGLLDNVNIRRAVRYAIDVDRIAASVYMGMVVRTDTPLIPGTWLYNENLTDYFRSDPDEARRLLEEEGWADNDDNGYLDRATPEGESQELSMRILVYEEPDNSVRIETANLISSQLAAVGIHAEVTTVSMDQMKDRLAAGNFHLALVSYAMDVCPDPGFLLMSGNTGNFGRYRSSKMNDLFDTLRSCRTQEDYQKTIWDIQSLYAEDCPFLCLFYRAGTVLTRRMYTTVRDVRELELLRGIEDFHND